MTSSDFNKYIKSSEFRALLAQYENALKTGEMVFLDSDDIVDIAEYYHIAGEIEKAEEAADYCLSLYPNESAPLLFKTRMALVDYCDVDMARSFLNQVEEEDESLETVYVTAEIMMNDVGVRKADEYLQEKYASFMEGNYVLDCDDEMDEEEDTPDFALDVAMMYCEHGYDEYAEKWMEKTSIPEGSAATDYYDTWARIYMAQSRWDEAVVMIDKLIDIDAYSVHAWLMMSEARFNQVQYQEALQSAEYAVAIAPDAPEPYITRGNCLYALNHLEAAQKSFERYLEICPEEPVGELLLASTLFCLKKTQEAFEHVKVLIKNFDYLPVAQARDALKTSASIAAKAGDISLAMDCCERLEDLDDGTEEADLIRGSVYLEANDIGMAMKYFSKVSAETDYSPQTVSRIGVICYEAGLLLLAYQMLKEAIKPYEEVGLEDCPPQTIAFLTGACRNLGNRDEYLYYLKHAVRIAPLDTASVLGDYFPPGTEVRDYWEIEQKRKDEK